MTIMAYYYRFFCNLENRKCKYANMQTNLSLPMCLVQKCTFSASHKRCIKLFAPFQGAVIYTRAQGRLCEDWCQVINNQVRAHDVIRAEHAVNTP